MGRHFETPTSKTDRLNFLTNKRLLAGTIYIRFFIDLKAIYGQKKKIKEIDFSTLSMKLRFNCSIFPDLRSYSGYH